MPCLQALSNATKYTFAYYIPFMGLDGNVSKLQFSSLVRKTNDAKNKSQ